MQLEVSLPFGHGSDGQSFFDLLPSAPAVFALFPETTAPGSAPYISRTRDLRRRLTRLLGEALTSSKRLNLREVTCRVEYQGVGSTFEAQWLLYLLNKVYYPRTYRHRLRLKPPALLKVSLGNRFPGVTPRGVFRTTARFTMAPSPAESLLSDSRPSSSTCSRFGVALRI